jgi:hypothetical protein
MEKIKEPGPYFHLSLDNDKIEDLFSFQLGLLQTANNGILRNKLSIRR